MSSKLNLKIGIMGGTFNPVHMGHLMLAQTALSQFQLDKVWFMPNKTPDYKSTSELLPASVRMEMLQLAIGDNPGFELSDFEINRSGFTYTFETLQLLREAYPDQIYYFILGGDSLFSFAAWKNPERIAKNCVILAAPRNHTSRQEMERQCALLEMQYGAKIFPLDCPNLDISSEMIRKKVKNNQSVRYFVPEKVYNYIISRNLYKLNQNERMGYQKDGSK